MLESVQKDRSSNVQRRSYLRTPLFIVASSFYRAVSRKLLQVELLVREISEDFSSVEACFVMHP